jgi:hypothetical protein
MSERFETAEELNPDEKPEVNVVVDSSEVLTDSQTKLTSKTEKSTPSALAQIEGIDSVGAKAKGLSVVQWQNANLVFAGQIKELALAAKFSFDSEAADITSGLTIDLGMDLGPMSAGLKLPNYSLFPNEEEGLGSELRLGLDGDNIAGELTFVSTPDGIRIIEGDFAVGKTKFNLSSSQVGGGIFNVEAVQVERSFNTGHGKLSAKGEADFSTDERKVFAKYTFVI